MGYDYERVANGVLTKDQDGRIVLVSPSLLGSTYLDVLEELERAMDKRVTISITVHN